MDAKQQATIILCILFFAVLLMRRSTRQALGDIAKAFFKMKLLVSLVLYVLVLVAAVYGAWRIELWVPKLWSDTVFWIVFSGLGWWFGVNDAAKSVSIPFRL